MTEKINLAYRLLIKMFKKLGPLPCSISENTEKDKTSSIEFEQNNVGVISIKSKDTLVGYKTD